MLLTTTLPLNSPYVTYLRSTRVEILLRMCFGVTRNKSPAELPNPSILILDYKGHPPKFLGTFKIVGGGGVILATLNPKPKPTLQDDTTDEPDESPETPDGASTSIQRAQHPSIKEYALNKPWSKFLKKGLYRELSWGLLRGILGV